MFEINLIIWYYYKIIQHKVLVCKKNHNLLQYKIIWIIPATISQLTWAYIFIWLLMVQSLTYIIILHIISQALMFLFFSTKIYPLEGPFYLLNIIKLLFQLLNTLRNQFWLIFTNYWNWYISNKSWLGPRNIHVFYHMYCILKEWSNYILIYLQDEFFKIQCSI